MTIKILALCGFTQNATIYSKQVSTFKRPAAMADGIGSGLAHWVDLGAILLWPDDMPETGVRV